MPAADSRDSVANVGIGYSRSPSTPGGFSKNSGESVTTLTVRAVLEAAAGAGSTRRTPTPGSPTRRRTRSNPRVCCGRAARGTSTT